MGLNFCGVMVMKPEAELSSSSLPVLGPHVREDDGSEPENYNDLFESQYDRAVPERAAFGASAADILSPGRGFMNSFDFTMQVQVGCPAGCLFCYVRTGGRLAPADVRRDWGYIVRNKTRATALFQKHLLAGAIAGKTIYWSGVTDPYAAPPEVTRSIWQALLEADASLRPERICVQSRFTVDRDVELIGDYVQQTTSSDGGPPVVVSYTINSDDDYYIRLWERATPLFERRMLVVKRLREAGIAVVPTFSPCCKWIDLPATLRRLREMCDLFVTVLFFKESCASASTPREFLDYLREHHPELLSSDWHQQRLAEMHAVFGANKVLEGKAGFTALIAPQNV